MKSIELSVSKENISGRDTLLNTYDLLKSVINNPTQGGLNVDEMIKRLRLLNELDKYESTFTFKEGEVNDELLAKKETLELEDSDFNKLHELFKEMKWGVVSKTIIELSKQFN